MAFHASRAGRCFRPIERPSHDPHPNTLLFIDGQGPPAAGGRVIPVSDPATANRIGNVAPASLDDLDAALAAADRGFQLWRRTSAHDRAKLMRRAADILRGRAEDVASLMVRENGKPLAQARLEALAGADIIDWFAGEAQRIYGQVIPSRAPEVL